MIRDRTGRFAERPHYDAAELDAECERIGHDLLRRRHGTVRFPITTDDLEVLIEDHGADLDAYVDLSSYGDDVDGMAEFFLDQGPEVSISKRLSTDERRGNRYRTTLAHEFGHVHFHGHLWRDKFATSPLFGQSGDEAKAICKRSDILHAAAFDWMEWQAGYVSGAILMPASRVRRLVSDYCGVQSLPAAVHGQSAHGRALIAQVMEAFAVSEEAARVRLFKLDLLAASGRQQALFG
jgi:Zn-dependent peptidase ImmA (M78 family)